MKIEIDSSQIEQLLREIRRAHLEGFTSCQFTDKREEDLFNDSIAASVIDSYKKEHNLCVII